MSFSLAAAGWILIYSLAGPMIIFLNSYTVNKGGFPFPVTFSALGIWGSAVIGQIAVHMGFWTVKKTFTVSEYCRVVLPNAFLSCLTIALGNSVYAYQSVAFTQMLKSLTPVYLVLAMAMLGVKVPSMSAILGVLVIVVGTAIASLGELRFSVTGFALQTVADISEGTRLVLLQLLMSKEKLTPFETIYYLFPATGLFQLLIALQFETAAFTNPVYLTMYFTKWYLFIAGIVLGFIINFTGNNVVSHTSGLTFKLIGIVRNNLLVVAAVCFFGDVTTGLQIAGYVISVAGFLWYSKVEVEAANQANYDKIQTSPNSPAEQLQLIKAPI